MIFIFMEDFLVFRGIFIFIFCYNFKKNFSSLIFYFIYFFVFIILCPVNEGQIFIIHVHGMLMWLGSKLGYSGVTLRSSYVVCIIIIRWQLLIMYTL